MLGERIDRSEAEPGGVFVREACRRVRHRSTDERERGLRIFPPCTKERVVSCNGGVARRARRDSMKLALSRCIELRVDLLADEAVRETAPSVGGVQNARGKDVVERIYLVAGDRSECRLRQVSPDHRGRLDEPSRRHGQEREVFANHFLDSDRDLLRPGEQELFDEEWVPL
jgi:hypothetical protein